MHSWSTKSRNNLKTSHKDLQILFNLVLRYWDCSVVWGNRGKDDQDLMYLKGYSTLRYPDSKHNKLPSHAVDVVPYPSGWSDTEKLIRFGSFVKWFAGVLYDTGVIKNNIEWGGDWKNFPDPAHWQIEGKQTPDPKKIKEGSLLAELYYE